MAISENWQQLQDLFRSAIALRPNERAAYLKRACRGNESLRQSVESLIQSHEEADHFIDSPAFEAVAEMLADGDAFKPGQTLGHYQIKSVLGEGGMGKVYLAEDTKLKRKVALKILPSARGGAEQARRRLLREAQVSAALDHSNICAIYEVDEESDPSYIAMQYVEGETLEARMTRERLSLDEALSIGVQVADALSEAHAHNIVHRDIKPSNIMLASRGQVKVLDFGLAKTVSPAFGLNEAETKRLLTTPGMILGTVPYMSPEQVRGEAVDVRTDIFSFGVVLYEMFSGQRAFARDSAADTIGAILHQQPPALSAIDASIPKALEDVVGKCLAKDAEERYQTMEQVAHDLNARGNSELAAMGIPATTTGKAGMPSTDRGVATSTDGGIAHPASSIEFLVSKVKSHKLSGMLATAAVVIAVAVFGSYFYFAKAAEPIDSVAVLPFVNVSNNADTEYLSDGLSDSIISSLSQLPNLKKVISLSSVLRYKGKQTDPQVVGRELNVRAVLMGRLTQHGDDLLISTELVDVKDNKRLWGGQYNRKLADVLKLQGEIAQEITDRLRLKLTGEEKQRLAKRDTDNPEAYQLYMLGRFYRRNRLDFQKARDYLEQAIQKDPNFAPAYAQLAYTYNNLSFRASEKEARQKAEWAARRALELDDTLGDAHTVLGLLNADVRLRELERALELDPNSADAQQFYAKILWTLGRLDEAILRMRRAQELDPLSPAMYVDLGKMLNSARRFDEAMQQYRKALELNPEYAPAHRHIGFCYAARGKYEEAIAEAELIKDPANYLDLRGYVYGRWGKRAEALKVLDEMNKLSKQRDVNPQSFALIYAGLGDKDKAFELLQQEQAPMFFPLRVDPVWDSLRSDPRFEELLRQRQSRGG